MIQVLMVGRSVPIRPSEAIEFDQAEQFSFATVDTLFEAEKVLSDTKSPCVTVIGTRVPIHDASAFAARISRTRGDVVSILEVSEVTSDVLKDALRTGFRDVVGEDSDELIESIRNAHENVQAASDPVVSGRERTGSPGRVISFLSPKGGVGKTVLATNTAIGIAQRDGGRVILLDLNRQFGDAGLFLGMPPNVDASDFASHLDRMDGDLLSGLLQPHKSGVDVLLAPARMDFSQRMTEVQLETLLKVARSIADFVILDTAPSFDENVRVLLSESDGVFLVTTLDVPSVKNTQMMLQTLSAVPYPEERVKVVLNRADSKVSLTPGEVEHHLKQKIHLRVPSDGAIPRSVNEGLPILQEVGVNGSAKLAGKAKRRIAKNLAELVVAAMDTQPRVNRIETDHSAGAIQ